MKPERIQRKLGSLTGWSRGEDGGLVRLWRVPSRRAAGLLNAYLMEMAEALDLELEIGIRSDPEIRAYRRGWLLEARLGDGELSLEQIVSAARLEGLPD